MRKRILPLVLVGLWFAVPLPAREATPRFGPAEAVQAEWLRQPPALAPEEAALLPPADKARLERTLARIGAPGAPLMMPKEYMMPDLPTWEEKARQAVTPEERFTALFCLNRLRSTQALTALRGLTAADAAAWPKHLHLENQLAAARLLGAEPDEGLQAFLAALAAQGKVDPVRAQAARLRLVAAGKEKELLPGLKPGAGAVLALLDAWNRLPWEKREARHLELLSAVVSTAGATGPALEAWAALGLDASRDPAFASSRDGRCGPLWDGVYCRLLDGLPDGYAPRDASAVFPPAPPARPGSHARQCRLAWFAALGRMAPSPAAAEALRKAAASPEILADPLSAAALLPGLRRNAPEAADRLRQTLLAGKDPVARGLAVEDLPAPPADLDALVKRVLGDSELDGCQAILAALDRWKTTNDQAKALLTPWLAHPDWSKRYLAYLQLTARGIEVPWPGTPAPVPTPRDRKLLRLAKQLAADGKKVRLEIEFTGHRRIVLALDPTVAPMNVANLLLLAGEGFFAGRLVPRVVPDFVVQMGSPYDTMDGGPGFSVRCENSPTFYGPGSVGMALSGKDTGGCQFFLTTNATPHLSWRYTHLGFVEDPDRALPILDGLELYAGIVRVRRID